MSKAFLSMAMASLIVLTGCAAKKPRIILMDNVPGEEARADIRQAVDVVWDDEAVRYDNPSTVTPLQIVVPRRNITSISELFYRPEYKLRLFTTGAPERLEVVYAIAGTKELCGKEQTAYSFEEYLNTKKNAGAIRCGDTIFTVDSDRKLLIGSQIVAEDVGESMNRSKISRVLIKYRKSQKVGR